MKSSIKAAVALSLACIVTSASAQLVDPVSSWEEEQSIDQTLQALLGPVWQPVYFTERDGRGISTLSHIYKQQPPGAQGDFRPPAPSPVSPTPKPVTPVAPGPAPDPDPSPEPVADNNTPPPAPPAPPPEPPPNNQPCPIIIFDPSCIGP